MAINRLFAALASAALAGCLAVSASAEVAILDSSDEPVPADSAAASAVQQEETAPPDLSDSALDETVRYSPDEIADILKDHPNAFTAAADPADGSETSSDQSTEDTAQPDRDSTQTLADSGTIWEKSFNSYTPTEGYLLLLFVLAVSLMAFKLVRVVWL